MEHRFAATVLVEVTATWHPEWESFIAHGRTRGGELQFEIGGPRHYPTMPAFTAALRGLGISVSAADVNRLLSEQESMQNAVTRAKSKRPAA